jgi:hypothetical protein
VVGGPPYLQQQPNRACIAVSEKPRMEQAHLLPLQECQLSSSLDCFPLTRVRKYWPLQLWIGCN